MDRPWGAILKDIDAAISKLPAKGRRASERKEQLTEASVYLHHVKNVWRNNVMHPKQSYDTDEAERIFANTKQYMEHLATTI